jgi:phosphoribosylanthranilate isomerase
VPAPADPVRVKICGLTVPEEAAACAEVGAWAVGVVFAEESSRRVTVAQGAAVMAAVPDPVSRVGVFVERPDGLIERAVRECRLTHIQVHGECDADELRRRHGVPVIAGFSVDGPDALQRARASAADLVLLDASVRGRHGGTGRRFDWSLLERQPLGRAFMLAGGLSPSNAGEAASRLRPWAIDVSSGVETAPGRKDRELVRTLIAAVGAAPVAAA